MESAKTFPLPPNARLRVIGFCLFIAFSQHVKSVHSQKALPNITCGTVNVPEDKAIGSTLFSVSVEVMSGSYPAVNVTLTRVNDATKYLVNLTDAEYNSTSGLWFSDVILAAELDRDFQPDTRKLSFQAEDTANNADSIYCTLIIRDVNDNPPTFLEVPYSINVLENTTVGEMVFSFSVTDPDSGHGKRVTLYPQFPDSAVEAMFNTSVTYIDETYTKMEVTLAQPLDYETRSFYDFAVVAEDGLGLKSIEAVEVAVADVQDTPPFFLQFTYRAAIRENEAAGTYVIKVSAVDGDRDPPNDVVYTFANGSVDLFHINNVTGEITSNAVFDRDSPDMLDNSGTFHLTVRATELTTDGTAQEGDATSEVAVFVMVEDVNDNGPTFSSSRPYTAFVREDVPQDSLIYFSGDGYVSVSDADQGTNSHFTMTVERDGVPWTQLEATPSEVYSEAFVLLKVKDPEVFKGSTGQHINLQLVAREVSTPERRSSTAEVVIAVEPAPEPPTAQAPIVDNSTTASDVVVFVIGFIVIFNVAATFFIVWFILRRLRPKEARQGLVRKGSKYYVNGADNFGFRKGEGAGLGSPVRPDSVLAEVDGKDRCDVVPLSAVLTSEQRNQYPAAAGVGLTGHRKPGSEGSEAVVTDDSAMDSSDRTERKFLVANEVSPATNNKPGQPAPTAAEAGVSAKERLSLPAATATKTAAAPPPPPATPSTTAATSLPLPDFTMAKRNVSSPHSPSVSFVNPAAPVTTASSAVSAFPPSIKLASSAFPPATTDVKSGTATTTTAAATPAVAIATATAATPVEPVTRFSAKGVVSTTVAAIPGYAVAASVGLPGGTTVSAGSGSDATRAAARAPRADEPVMTEVLY